MRVPRIRTFDPFLKMPKQFKKSEEMTGRKKIQCNQLIAMRIEKLWINRQQENRWKREINFNTFNVDCTIIFNMFGIELSRLSLVPSTFVNDMLLFSQRVGELFCWLQKTNWFKLKRYCKFVMLISCSKNKQATSWLSELRVWLLIFSVNQQFVEFPRGVTLG